MRELQVQNGEDETLSAIQDALNQEELLNAAADSLIAMRASLKI